MITASQYNEINELLFKFSTLNAALETAEAEIKTVQLAAAQDLLPKHAQAKVALAELESKLRSLSDRFYSELFPEDKKRTHATPFGALQLRKSTSLEVEDEEKSILRIKVACTKELARESEGVPPRFTESQLIRTREELNLEALGELDDITLAAFGIKRVQKDTFKIVPFDMKADSPKTSKSKRGAKSTIQEAA
jgi:hypothetical protein